MNNNYTYEQIFKNKKNVLLVVAHPDDSLVYFGGLLGKLKKDKKRVSVVVVTNGARGSRENEISEAELAEARVREEQEALHMVGVEPDRIHNLQYLDGEVESSCVS